MRGEVDDAPPTDGSSRDAARVPGLCHLRRAWRRQAEPAAFASPLPADKALIAITLDLEMSRHYPTWDQTHWDYEKGNLDAATKRYAVEAARRVKATGGVIHFFAVGQTMEQEDVGWLREIVAQGHPVGNHTYDHVNVKATRAEDIQFRFRGRRG